MSSPGVKEDPRCAVTSAKKLREAGCSVVARLPQAHGANVCPEGPGGPRPVVGTWVSKGISQMLHQEWPLRNSGQWLLYRHAAPVRSRLLIFKRSQKPRFLWEVFQSLNMGDKF